MRVAVAGGTGLVGRHVVDALTEAGHEPVVLARAHGVDITTGAGLDDALRGVRAVVDVSNVGTTRRDASIAFFEAGTRHLLEAELRAGVGHHVVLSIIGIDGVEFGYYQGKVRQEEIVRDGGVAWTVLRAAQFHEFAGQVLARVRGPLAIVPKLRTQPVAAREVADALVELAVGPAVGLAPELAGPREESLPVLARKLLRARGSRRIVVPIRMPGSAGRAMAGGALLPQGAGARGRLTFDEWLAQTG